MELLAFILREVFLITGALIMLIGSIGVVRFPEFFSRVHAAGVTDTAGMGFLFMGLFIEAGLSLVSVKLLIILTLMLLTSPTASHALAKAALHGNLSPLQQGGHQPSN